MPSSTRPGSDDVRRAGHTPLIFLPGPARRSPVSQILMPSGMVLGLRIDGAAEKFDELLEEHRIDLNIGDVIVLYTDGITEAMNSESDLFGDARLSEIVEEHGHLDSGELRERILREIEVVRRQRRPARRHDDDPAEGRTSRSRRAGAARTGTSRAGTADEPRIGRVSGSLQH